MREFSKHIFILYFLSLGLSSLWGGHVHHTDIHDIENSHIEKHSESSHHHENPDSVKNQDHCVKHCSVEDLLTHVIEGKTFTSVEILSLNTNQVKTSIYFRLVQFPKYLLVETVYSFSSESQVPWLDPWKSITTSTRPPPFSPSFN